MAGTPFLSKTVPFLLYIIWSFSLYSFTLPQIPSKSLAYTTLVFVVFPTDGGGSGSWVGNMWRWLKPEESFSVFSVATAKFLFNLQNSHPRYIYFPRILSALHSLASLRPRTFCPDYLFIKFLFIPIMFSYEPHVLFCDDDPLPFLQIVPWRLSRLFIAVCGVSVDCCCYCWLMDRTRARRWMNIKEPILFR